MSIYKKLFEAKKEIGVITKNAVNPFFKSNYLSLNGLIEAVEPILEKHNLLLLQPIENGCVVTRIYDIESEMTMESGMALPNIQDPQKLGSAITYYRRYTLQSLLGLLAQDDDGNTAATQVIEERKPAFKPGGWDYLTGGKATKEHIQQALDVNRMTPVERKQLEKLIA